MRHLRAATLPERAIQGAPCGTTAAPAALAARRNARAAIEKQFTEAGLGAEDRYKIVCGNSMRTFGFD